MSNPRYSLFPVAWCAGWVTVLTIAGISSAPGAEGVPAATATAPQTALTAWSNRRIAKTETCTVVVADSGGTLALGGNDFYRLTFDAAEKYPPTFAVAVLNEDRGRAKFVNLANGDSFYLWPQQTVVVFNQNNTWQTLGRAKWQLPTGPIAIHTDFARGSDEYGKSDGLDITS